MKLSIALATMLLIAGPALAQTSGQKRPTFNNPSKTINDFHAACLEHVYMSRTKQNPNDSMVMSPDDSMVRVNKTYAWKTCQHGRRDQPTTWMQ